MILKCAFVTFFQNRGGGRGKTLKEISMPLKKIRKWKYLTKKYYNYMKTCLGRLNKKEINEIINK